MATILADITARSGSLSNSRVFQVFQVGVHPGSRTNRLTDIISTDIDLFHSFTFCLQAELSDSGNTQTFTIHHCACLCVGLQDLGQTLPLQNVTLQQLLLLLSVHVLYLVQLLFTSMFRHTHTCT